MRGLLADQTFLSFDFGIGLLVMMVLEVEAAILVR